LEWLTERINITEKSLDRVVTELKTNLGETEKKITEKEDKIYASINKIADYVQILTEKYNDIENIKHYIDRLIKK